MDRDHIDENFEGFAEPPISAGAIACNVARAPDAARIAADLLRSIDVDSGERGIVQESLAYGLLQGSAEHASWLTIRPGGAMLSGKVRVTRIDDRLSIILDRPLARNAIDRDIRDALFEAFTVAALDREVRAVNLTATGKAFSIGADLSEFGTTRDPATAHAIRMATLPALAIVQCADKFSAHVQGACIGAGLEMAAFARRLTATHDAWFQLPELAMGLIPGAGGCVSVTRRIGRRRAALMILSGKRIGAATALDWGLIDAIVDDATLDECQANVVG